MAAKKENKKQLSNERKLKRAVKNATKVEVPEELRNGDLQILMPFVVSSMNSDFSKIQLDVILSIIEKIGMTLRDILDQKKGFSPKKSYVMILIKSRSKYLLRSSVFHRTITRSYVLP